MRRILQNLALSAASLAVVVGVLEGASRFVLSRRPKPPERADYIWDWEKHWDGDFYTMASDETGWPPGAEFNGDGVRDRTHPRQRTEGIARVVFLGDSVTLGHGLEPQDAYPQVLQSRLDDQGRAVEVMNVALWGWSTRQERIAYEKLVRPYRPDLVVLAVCLNDIPEIQNNLKRPPGWLLALNERLALVRLLIDAPGREIQNVEELFTRSGEPKVREAVSLFFDEVRVLRDAVAKDGGRLALLVFPFRFQLAKTAPDPSVQGEIARFAEAERLPLLDLLPALREAGDDAFLDYDHVSVSGARRVAALLMKSDLLPERSALDLLKGTDALRALGDPKSEVRMAAAWTLGRATPPRPAAAVALADRLSSDPSAAVRLASARALGRAGAAQSGPKLAAALFDADQGVRFAAAEALAVAGITAEHVPDLVKALASDDGYIRAFATWALGSLGAAAGPEAAEALARAVESEGGAGRSGAALALAKMGAGAREAVPALIRQLEDPREARRWRAARTLGRIGPEARSAVPALAKRLQDPSPTVRIHAARALGRIASPEAIPALVRVLKEDPSKPAREEASRALSLIPGR